MALAAKKKKLSLSLAVVVILLLLLFSAAAASFYFSMYARSKSYGTRKIQSTWENKGDEELFKGYLDLRGFQDERKYQGYSVRLWKHPNGDEAMDMDDKDARRRWYESFLPSTHTDSGERRLFYCGVNSFGASLTRAEAMALANKPGIRRMISDDGELFMSSKASCGFETTASASTKRKMSFVRSRLTFRRAG